MLAVQQSDVNDPEINARLNIISKGLQIASPHNFSMKKFKLSWPWTLLGSLLQIIFRISLAENVIVDNVYQSGNLDLFEVYYD